MTNWQVRLVAGSLEGCCALASRRSGGSCVACASQSHSGTGAWPPRAACLWGLWRSVQHMIWRCLCTQALITVSLPIVFAWLAALVFYVRSIVLLNQGASLQAIMGDVRFRQIRQVTSTVDPRNAPRPLSHGWFCVRLGYSRNCPPLTSPTDAPVRATPSCAPSSSIGLQQARYTPYSGRYQRPPSARLTSVT